jgi:hypothetical protein
VNSRVRRKPRNYDGTGITTHRMSDLLTSVLANISETYEMRPDLILSAWPSIVGPKLAPMTQAVAFTDGVLYVKVKNSTLHSLLSQHDKPKILQTLRQKFPRVAIQNIVFRIG